MSVNLFVLQSVVLVAFSIGYIIFFAVAIAVADYGYTFRCCPNGVGANGVAGRKYALRRRGSNAGADADPTSGDGHTVLSGVTAGTVGGGGTASSAAHHRSMAQQIPYTLRRSGLVMAVGCLIWSVDAGGGLGVYPMPFVALLNNTIPALFMLSGSLWVVKTSNGLYPLFNEKMPRGIPIVLYTLPVAYVAYGAVAIGVYFGSGRVYTTPIIVLNVLFLVVMWSVIGTMTAVFLILRNHLHRFIQNSLSGKLAVAAPKERTTATAPAAGSAPATAHTPPPVLSVNTAPAPAVARTPSPPPPPLVAADSGAAAATAAFATPLTVDTNARIESELVRSPIHDTGAGVGVGIIVPAGIQRTQSTTTLSATGGGLVSPKPARSGVRRPLLLEAITSANGGDGSGSGPASPIGELQPVGWATLNTPQHATDPVAAAASPVAAPALTRVMSPTHTTRPLVGTAASRPVASSSRAVPSFDHIHRALRRLALQVGVVIAVGMAGTAFLTLIIVRRVRDPVNTLNADFTYTSGQSYVATVNSMPLSLVLVLMWVCVSVANPFTADDCHCGCGCLSRIFRCCGGRHKHASTNERNRVFQFAPATGGGGAAAVSGAGTSPHVAVAVAAPPPAGVELRLVSENQPPSPPPQPAVALR